MKSNKKILLKRIIFFILLISTFILIFIFSSQDGNESIKTSQGFIYNILKFFTNNNEKLDDIIIFLEPIIRKLAHFTIYTLVGIWSINLLETYKLEEKNKIIISLLIGFLYACSDEFHQSFVGERSASIRDVLIDTLGVLFGILIVIFVIKLMAKNKRKTRKNNKILQ